MSTSQLGSAPPEVGPAPASAGIEAVCLRRDGGDVLVMLHAPDLAEAPDAAVLLCPPFGWQEVCSYRSVRTWARALAGAGYATARLTLPSGGDSAGDPADPGRLEQWTGAVTDAAAWLRGHTGAVRVIVAGIGLGGMVACRAVAEGAPVDDLVLWAVPSRGRTLLRELRAHHQMVAAEFPEDEREAASETAGLELIGYPMSAETGEEVGRLDLAALGLGAGSPNRRALILGRGGLAADRKLVDHLRDGGWEVELAAGGDFAELVANPQQSVAPETTIGHMLQWLRSVPPGRPGPMASAPAGATAAPGPTAPARPAPMLRCRSAAAELIETPLWLEGRQGRVFAVVTQPAEADRRAIGAVFLGAGAVPHTGPNRSWVVLARRWAARGMPVVRVDLSGIGEADGDDPHLLTDRCFYEDWRDAEIEGVLDQLQSHGLADQFVLGGLCSGAYQALRRGLADPRVTGLFLMNLYAFRFSVELAKERGRRAAIAGGLPNARGRSLDREFVSKAAAYLRPDRAWRLLRRSAERAQRAEAIAALDRLRDTTVRTGLVLGGDEPLLAELRRQGLLDQLDRWPNLELTLLGSRDHMYRAAWLQREVFAALDRVIDRVLAEPTPPGLK